MRKVRRRNGIASKIIIYDRDIILLAYITCRSNKNPPVALSNCHSHNLFSSLSGISCDFFLYVILYAFK